MHQACKDFIKSVRRELPHKFRFRSVLEVGSRNINGSPRKYFWFCKYVGIDLSKGKGVDLVCDICDMVAIDNFDTWDCVVSCEMLEHCSEWRQALKRMFYFTKPNGLLLITCAGIDRGEHGTTRTSPKDSPDTNDYYRNISTEDFKSVLPSELFSHYILMYGRGKNDLYFYGIKK